MYTTATSVLSCPRHNRRIVREWLAIYRERICKFEAICHFEGLGDSYAQ